MNIPEEEEYILWYSDIDDWQFAYRTPHGWVTRTRREVWDSLVSTELLEKMIPVYATVKYLKENR